MNTANSAIPKAAQPKPNTRLFNYIVLAIIVIFLITAPFWIGSYGRDMLIKVLIFAIFALSVNLLWGYGGMISLGQAAFFGVGAYTAGIMMVKYGITNFWVVLLAGLILSTVAAFLFGAVALRTKGVYFLFVTMAFGELLQAVANNWISLTDGANGTVGIPYPNLGFNVVLNVSGFYYLVLIITVICVYLIYRFVKGPFGTALQGIRDDELRMSHLGYNTWLHKLITLGISGMLAGLCGILYASATGSIVPSVLSVVISAQGVLMIVIGGMQIFGGPILGAAIIQILFYYVSIFAPQRWSFILGFIFVLTVIFLRGGIAIHLVRLWNKVRVQIWKS